MKKKLLAFAMILFTSMGLFAQGISGVVTNSSTQAAIANQTIYLQGDSLSGVYMTTTSNAGGQYSFTNVGSSNFYDVYTYDCNQNYVGQTKNTLPATANFSICTGSSTNCQAIFSSNPDSINTSMYYFFDASTGSPTSWTWNFGDGTSSSLQNPTHTYASAGNYTVTLSISSAACNNSTSSTITVGTPPPGCQANFYSTPNSSNANMILFTDNSTGSPTSWSWNFGDGTTSNLQNPTHTYTAGTYTVSLTIWGANCQSNTSQTIVIAGGSTNYSISGAVMAGSQALDVGMVQLYTANGGVFVTQTPLDTNGGYSFGNVSAGNYLIYAIPSPNSTFTNYASTYYTSSILWSSATTLSVNSNQTGIDINLFQIVPIAGSGSASGNVSTGVKSVISGAVVNLLNSSNAPVASTITDLNGDYSFSNLADGTYKIWVEIAGKTTTPIIITINSTNQTSTNNDFEVKGNTVTPKTVSINNSSRELEIKTFPNPVSDQLNIALSLENSTLVSVEIYNLAGQIIVSNNYDLQAGSQTIRINLNELAKGSYILKITNTNGAHTQQLITKIK